MFKIILAFLLFFAFGLSGCASDALSEESNAPDSSKSLVLLVLHLENRVKPEHQAWGIEMSVTNTQTNQATTFRFHPPEIQADNSHVEHLIAIPVDPGSYTITQLHCGRDVVLFKYSFNVNPNVQFQTPSPATTYIGCLQVINRAPQADEKSSGKVFPVVGQALSGYGGGVTDIIVVDRRQSDIPRFIATYPFLKSRKIDTRILTASQTVSR